MTLPRRVRPGATCLITRRCTQRTFLLVPRGITREVFAYLLSHLAERYGVLIHAAVVMTNHYHLVITDTRGRYPDFLRDLDSLLTRVLNAEYGRREALWSSARPNVVELLTDESIWQALSYTITNPVKAGLVRTPSEWPGFRTSPRDVLAGTQFIPRPKARFFRDSRAPEQAERTVTVPPALSSMRAVAYVDELTQRVGARVREKREEMRRGGRSFLGARRVKKQRRTSRPKSPGQPRGRVPTIACHDPARRKEEAQELCRWRSQYREARRCWLEGESEAEFPFGTFHMARLPGVRCERAPPPWQRAA